MSGAALPLPAPRGATRAQALGVGLWAFIGVATALFALFGIAYVVRMTGDDWSSIALPRTLWLSTALLGTGSVLMQQAAAAARRARPARARARLRAGGLCAVAFLGAQLGSWQVLQAAFVTLAGNPAASFFYLLTAMHGLHVLGGLVAWAATDHALAQRGTAAAAAVALCARYWHFLLAVWLALYAAMALLTPEFARLVCGVPR